MNKTSIKVIKRKNAEVMTNAGTQSACEPKQAAALAREKIERRSRRALVATISNWIYERRVNNRIEESAAIRQLFGNELC